MPNADSWLSLRPKCFKKTSTSSEEYTELGRFFSICVVSSICRALNKIEYACSLSFLLVLALATVAASVKVVAEIVAEDAVQSVEEEQNAD